MKEPSALFVCITVYNLRVLWHINVSNLALHCYLGNAIIMFYVALHFPHLISEFLELSALSVVGDTRKRVKLSGCSDYSCVLLGGDKMLRTCQRSKNSPKMFSIFSECLVCLLRNSCACSSYQFKGREFSLHDSLTAFGFKCIVTAWISLTRPPDSGFIKPVL